MIDVFKWMKGYNKGDVNKVLIVREQGRTRSSVFKLDTFRFNKDKEELVYKQGSR